ncbi:zinc finger protein 469 [Hoplias malabaricus]|uniref:zinc finger protein 469 n=1 Tax=Hoplias malabaricus TaxID=27720 RepID=UPI00346354BB
MAGETKRTYATKELDTEFNQQEKGTAREQFKEKGLKESPKHFQNVSLESQTVTNGAKFIEKERENTQQREAVIRPQQAGKIDFKSLQNRSKFTSDRSWPGGKGSPQSPSGKSRNRDKAKKSGKGERGNPQQLYRLSITNPRSNPTIGIAYPQQKVSPPKKLEASRGPVAGSYRFHVPSIPEREAELHQEELNYNRCFQESSSNLTSPSYTSQPVGSAAGGPAHQHPPATTPQQQPGPLETSNPQPVSQILFTDFQLSGADMWQSPDRTFNNSNFGVPSQKPNTLMEVNKANGFVPLSFQYGYSLLDDAASDPFPCDQNPQSQDFIETSLGPNQNSFSFQSSGEEHDNVQSNTQFSTEKSEDRPPYTVHSKPPQYVQSPHGIPSSVHCTRAISEDVSNGESSVSNSHQSEQNKSVLPNKSDTYCSVDNRDTSVTTGGKRDCLSKNGACTQRILIQSSVHHVRNIAQSQSSQMHFSNKAYSSPPSNTIHMGSAPHDKNNNKSHNRATQSWEGPNKTFSSSMDQNSTPFPVQCQTPLEQRQNAGINSRLPWQQIHLTSAMPNQNRIELSRQLSNQQLTFLLAPSDWQEDSKSQKSNTQKSSNNFPSKRPCEAFSNLRQDGTKQSCSTIAPCQFTSKMEPVQGQVTDTKNKSLYFGINQTIHGSSTRTPSYPPLQVPNIGLMMVSPYDSPSHSPIQNPASTSTCSSLSPESTSPANSSSDDNQNTKVPPPQFYHQHQGKTTSDNLNSNQHHYHSDVTHSLHYNQERAKENIVSFSPSIRHPKHGNMESVKGCMDGYSMEHPPPPPYSAHQLLTSSLATANLDQLDVLLTCKQCDQNFNNLASFLDHKQYCGQHSFAQNDFKDIRKMEDTRKFNSDHAKAISSGSNFTMSRSSSDLHLSLLGLNKNGEIMPDTEPKGDAKDDPMKLMLPSAPLPDLEMEDAKLDSLITEALNGLGYQSDNAEIDSSFIDAFTDDEITTMKCSSNRQTLKTKDSIVFESRSKHEFTSSEKSLTQGKYSFDVDCLGSESKHTDVIHKENKTDSEACEKSAKGETALVKRECTSEESSTHTEWVKGTCKSDKTAEDSERGPRFLLSRNFSERCGLKSSQSSTPLIKTTVPQSPSATRSPTSQRPAVRDGKRKRASGGSWSKELIHKIVQQKNKLHKLHVKGTKNMQFSLVMERVTPTVQNPTFREYDYVSDSDEDCEPVKIASQGHLSQSIRCKYTYTKECKGRIRADRNRDSQWKQDKIESFESKKPEAVSPSSIKETSGHQRVRRRSSRSSTSSEISASVSISSESISSPKSIDRTDSDCEKRMEIRKKDQDSCEQESSPQRVLKESSTSLALTFTKNTKHYSTDKILLSELKDSYSASKCSNVISTSQETASEHTLTKSTVSLSRFKTTRLEVEEQMDQYGCEIGIAAGNEEPTQLSKEYKDYMAGTHLRKTGVTLNSVKTQNDKERAHPGKIKRDKNDISNEKSLQKNREGHKSHQDPECSPTTFENSSDISSVKETKPSLGDLFAEPPALSSSVMDDVCVSTAKLHDTPSQKDRTCLMPYSLEHDQSLMKSPLSFDTSSMFGDLTVGGFDNNLYPDIQITKEGFGPIETTAHKKDLFEAPFSPLTEQRDWSLMVDVTPELPDEISQYKESSDITNDKKTRFNNVPFTLPEKIIDYHPNLNTCVSEDELEIKRIVTELESQLQTAKLSSPSPLDTETPKHLTMSKFSPLRLGHENESEQSGLDMDCSSESLALAAPPDSHPELFSEPDLPWSSPVQFGLMGGQQCLHTPTHSSVTDTPINLGQEKTDEKDDRDLQVLFTEKHQALNIEEKTESNDSVGTDKSEEMIEHEIYTENLMKSLEVMSDSLSSGLESSRSPLQETEQCVSEQEQEKEDNDRTEPTDETVRVEAENLAVDFTKCEIDLNKKLSEYQHSPITQGINESKSDGDLVTDENISAAENSDIILHVENVHLKVQPDENICASTSPKDCEESSNTINLSESPLNIFEPKSCEQSVSHVETGQDGFEPQIIEDHSKSSHNNPKIPQILSDELKEEKTVPLKQESSQPEELNATKDTTSAKNNHQVYKNETDTVENAKIIASPYSSGVHIHEIQERDKCTILEQPQMEKENQCWEPTLYMTFSPVCSASEEHVQNKDDSKEEHVPPMTSSSLSPLHISSKKSTDQADKSPLTVCWGDISMITHGLIEERSSLERQSAEDMDVGGSLGNFESSVKTTEMDNSFVTHMDYAETTESKISSPGTILAVESISKQPFSEASEKSEQLDVAQNKDTLYEFKLSPLNYSESHFSDCGSKIISNEMDAPPNVKSSPKDSLNFSSCALTLNAQLSSNCRLSPIHVQNELELTSRDNLVKNDITHFPDTACQNNKYSYVSTTHHLQGENTASTNMEQLAKISQDDISTCHVPLNYIDLHINLMKKAEAENTDSHVNTFKPDAMPSVQETLNCKEQLSAASVSLTNMPAPVMGQSTKQSSPKKSGAQNTIQGKFQCEVCLMYFRTVPGLKRHKAMKHTVKAEGVTVQNTTVSNQGFVPVYHQSVSKDLKDSTGILDPVVMLSPHRDGVPARPEDQVPLALVFKDTVNELNVLKSAKRKDKEDEHLLTQTPKKTSKVIKSKSIDINDEGLIPVLIKQDTFSEELLSILKTDILQEISPDFPSVQQPECLRSPKTQSTTDILSCQDMKAIEEHQDTERAKDQEIEATSTKHPNFYDHGAAEEDTTTIAQTCAMSGTENNEQEKPQKEIADTKEFLDVKEICDPCEDPVVAIKCETSTGENDTNSEGCKEHSLCPSGLDPDLKALFDDESTFSQLFPRNDEMKRKKCARVYGKSNKKQKQMQSLVPDYTGPSMFLDKDEENKKNKDNTFVSSLSDNCEYETISLDDANMLEMCQKSMLKSSAENNAATDGLTDHQTEYEDTPEVSIKDFLCQTEDALKKNSMHLENSESTSKEKAGSSGNQGDCKAEVPASPALLESACVQDDLTPHPSIDIQNLNTTFQLPEIQFFEPGRNIPLVEDIASNSTEVKEPDKSPKKPTERKGRKRIETGLKPKDKQYKCKVCFTWFLTLGELDFHKLSHNPSPPPTCYMCVQRKFSSREQLRDHLREKHAKNKAGVWTCGMCLKEISDVWMYNEHLREHATQFARKGQSQSSLLDMPGCLMQENAVKNFISSIMQHRSNKSMKGENAKSSKEERKAPVDAPGVEQKSSNTCESATIKTKVCTGGGSKHSTLTPLEVLHKADTTPKNVEMHPNCKDPSRDCHHCGKQFPKPFKLQRHLVVHSLQKIFMCHKCPVSYQEAKELKDHLKNEHEELDELDSKHTTLYTCELCADVMHVIKKSFICSTCNYTFSKKEQFDRHMEKHLAGGNKIFKFRGVIRPGKPLKSKDDEFDIPPTKRRKVLSESSLDNSLDSGIASVASVHLSQSVDSQGLKTIVEDFPCNRSDEQSTETNNTSVKMEDEHEDLSVVLEDQGHCQPITEPDEHTLPTNTVPKEEDNENSHAHELQDTDTREVGTDNRNSPVETYNVKIEEECGAIPNTPPKLLSNESSVLEISVNECSGLSNADNMIQNENSHLCDLQLSDQTSEYMKSQQTEGTLPTEGYHLEFGKPLSPSHNIRQQQLDQLNEHSSTDRNECEQNTNIVEQPVCILVRDKTSSKSCENSKQCLDNSPRLGNLGSPDTVSVNHSKIPPSSIICEDKDSIKQKKRKDLKITQSSQRTASPATRENLGIDPKVKKKFRPNKCDSVTGQRKADVCGDYPVLTSVKDDTASNKIVSKHKTGTLGLQPKKGSLDSFPPRKGELVRHLNGDCRGKKGVPGRSIHSPTPKVSIASLNNSFNKSRHKPGSKSVETHSYRTAESQNNLLSQLFGQRLTGFKIPLRKDTSESIN